MVSLPRAQIFCGMPPLITPSHAPPLRQPSTDNTFSLPLIQPKSPSQQDAAARQPPPGSSSLLSSTLQHQANCLQAIHKTIQQFNQHLEAEHLDRKTLQLIVLQLQNDFSLLRYLLFPSVGTIPICDTSSKNAVSSPPVHPKPNPNPNPIPTSNALLLPCTAEPSVRRSTPEGTVGPLRARRSNSANADVQPTRNTHEAPPITAQNLTSKIPKLKKLFADEIASYSSITAGIHSQYFFLLDKIRHLETGNSDAIIWKTPSVKFVFDSAKVARPSSGPLIEPPKSFGSPIFRTHHHGNIFFIKFYPYGIGPATGKCASILFTLFPNDYDNLLQSPFSKLFHVGIRDKLDPLITWTKTIHPDQDPAYKKPTNSTKTGVATIIINNFFPHSKTFSETEGFLIDGASYTEIKFSDPPLPINSHPNFPPFPVPIEPSIVFSSLSAG